MTQQQLLRTRYSPHEGQLEVHSLHAKEKWIEAARRWGKSRCALGELEAAVKNTFGVVMPVLLSVDDQSVSSLPAPNPVKPPKPVNNDDVLTIILTWWAKIQRTLAPPQSFCKITLSGVL